MALILGYRRDHPTHAIGWFPAGLDFPAEVMQRSKSTATDPAEVLLTSFISRWWRCALLSALVFCHVVALYKIFLLTCNRVRVTRFQQPGTRFLNRIISQLTTICTSVKCVHCDKTEEICDVLARPITCERIVIFG